MINKADGFIFGYQSGVLGIGVFSSNTLDFSLSTIKKPISGMGNFTASVKPMEL
jgi:hypothetical protein